LTSTINCEIWPLPCRLLHIPIKVISYSYKQNVFDKVKKLFLHSFETLSGWFWTPVKIVLYLIMLSHPKLDWFPYFKYPLTISNRRQGQKQALAAAMMISRHQVVCEISKCNISSRINLRTLPSKLLLFKNECGYAYGMVAIFFRQLAIDKHNKLWNMAVALPASPHPYKSNFIFL